MDEESTPAPERSEGRMTVRRLNPADLTRSALAEGRPAFVMDEYGIMHEVFGSA